MYSLTKVDPPCHGHHKINIVLITAPFEFLKEKKYVHAFIALKGLSEHILISGQIILESTLPFLCVIRSQTKKYFYFYISKLKLRTEQK